MALVRSNRVLLALAAAVIALLLVNGVLFAAVTLRGPGHELRIEVREASATEFYFDPQPLVAPARTAVALSFVNRSSAPHTLVLLAPIDRRTGPSVVPGTSERIDFTTPDAGTYRFVCSVHEGMRGTLIVE